MRSSRAMLYLQRLGELASQLSELENLRGLVEDAERSARGTSPLRYRLHAWRRRRGRDFGALSVRLHRYPPPSRDVGTVRPSENDNPIDGALLEPFPNGWWASP